MRQVGGFLRVLWFPPPIKLTATIYKNVTEILLKVALNTITLTIFHIKSIPKQEKSIINNDLSNTINLVFTLDKYYKNQQKIFIEIAHCIEYYKNKQNIYIEIAHCIEYYKNKQKIFIEIAHCIEYYKNKQKIYIEIAHCIEYYKNKQNIYIEIAHCIEYYKNKQNIYIEIARCY
jgi:hypothetical protein